jgi:hypothetical protein
MFLGQSSDADPSLKQAVARHVAQRVAEGKPACSSNTGAYSKARKRLPEKFLAELTRHVGNELVKQARITIILFSDKVWNQRNKGYEKSTMHGDCLSRNSRSDPDFAFGAPTTVQKTTAITILPRIFPLQINWEFSQLR